MKTLITLKTISACLSLTVLAACSSQSSDPLANFEKLETQKPQKVEPFNQTAVNPKLFSFKVNQSESNMAQYTENVETETFIEVSPLNSNIKHFDIQMTGFNFQNKPELLRTDKSNVLALRWKAPVGSIQAGQWGRTFTAEFLVVVTDSTNKLMIGTSNTFSLPVVLQRTQKQPKIVSKTDLKSLNEGESSVFTVDIEDPTAELDPRNPELIVTPYINSNTEAYKADGSSYLRLDTSRTQNPERVSKTLYRYHYVIDAQTFPLNRDRTGKEVPVSSELDICFYIRAVSAVGTLSEQLQVCLIGKYKTQPVQLTTASTWPTEITQIQPVIYDFEISAAHPLAEVQVIETETGLKTLSGTSNLSCLPVAEPALNKMKCTLTWNPPCRTVDANRKWTLKMQNKMDAKTVVTTKTFSTLVKAQKTCAQPK